MNQAEGLMGPKIEPSELPLEAPVAAVPLAPPEPARLSFGARLVRALREEVLDLNLRLVLATLVVSLLPDGCFARLRTVVYRLAGLQIGPRSLILGRIEFTGAGRLHENLRVGSHTIINAHFFADLNGPVTIGDWVAIGHHVTLITAEHELGPAYCRAGPTRPAPIQIGDGAWIGAGSTILPGTTLGKSIVVAAGSLVSGRVPDNKMVGGVPARPLKSLPPEP